MSIRNRSLCAVHALVLLAGTSAGGPIDPPAGPVTSSMKPLTEVEPRIALTAQNTPGDSSSVFKIVEPGSYYLTENLQVQGNIAGISVNASNVRIDLCGYTISGGSSAVLASSAAQGMSVSNGTLTNTGVGVQVFDSVAAGVRLADLRVTDTSSTGIRVGPTATIQRCSVSRTGGTAIIMGNGSTLRDSEVLDAAYGVLANTFSQITGCSIRGSGSGITSGGSAIIESCTIADITEAGIEVGGNASISNCTVTGSASGIVVSGPGSTITNCRASYNSGRGFDLGAENEIVGCVADRNGAVGIYAGFASVVRDCQAKRNGQQGIAIGTNSVLTGSYATLNGQVSSAAGIWINGSECRVEDNHSTGNDYGFWTTGTDNIIVRNSARGNDTNFQIAPGNELAPVLTNPGSNGYAGATAWSNIAY